MKAPAHPANEKQRLEALARYDVLDTLPEQPFDDLTALAAHILDVPIALVSLVDAERQWFKSRHGLDATETPREVSFCGHAVASGELLVVPDAQADARFADNPIVVGEPRVRFYAGTPLTTGKGEALGTLCAIDHVPRRLSPQQLELLEALGRQVMSQLDLRLELRRQAALIEEQRRLDSLKDEFVAVVSHELRTPLTSIHGSLGLLAGGVMGELPDEARSIVEIARTNSERLIRMIGDILDVEKLAAGKIDLRREPIGLLELLAASLEANRAYAEQHGVSFALRPSLEDALVLADPDRITQVVDNLLSNAAKYSPSGEVVELSVARHAKRLRVSVADRGPGIPEEFRDHIFERFAQASGRDHQRPGGTGLGLNIARSIIELHGGSIGFDTETGAGTTFWFELDQLEAPGVEATTRRNES